jgi:putative Ca2+/H+ antiporter (TMEM165/GDT1 family)
MSRAHTPSVQAVAVQVRSPTLAELTQSHPVICAIQSVLHSPVYQSMEALLISTGVVALAEIGDKTQLLAFILAARFKRPLPIIAGILVATLVNHGLAGAFGAWIASVISPDVMRWVLGGSFLGMAIWTLIPDKIEEEETQVAKHLGVFGATLVTFFLAEMGDKTQIATVALAAHYTTPLVVIAGTTLGMLIADVPAVFVGNRFAAKIPMKLVHAVAAGIFAVMGILTLLQVDCFLTSP